MDMDVSCPFPFTLFLCYRTDLCWVSDVMAQWIVFCILNQPSSTFHVVFSSIMKSQLPDPLVTGSFDCPHHHYILRQPLGTSRCEQNGEYITMLPVLLRWHSRLSDILIHIGEYLFWMPEKIRGEFPSQFLVSLLHFWWRYFFLTLLLSFFYLLF